MKSEMNHYISILYEIDKLEIRVHRERNSPDNSGECTKVENCKGEGELYKKGAAVKFVRRKQERKTHSKSSSRVLTTSMNEVTARAGFWCGRRLRFAGGADADEVERQQLHGGG